MSRPGRHVIAGLRGPATARLELSAPTAIRFSDLRERTIFASRPVDLELVGCVLGPDTLGAAALGALTFAGCYAPDAAQLAPEMRWPEPVAQATDRLLDTDDAERARAAEALGELGHAEAAGVLGYALTDPEWEVRAAALDALGALRGAGFPFADRELIEWIALRLGDDVDAVQARAWAMLAPIGADEIVTAAIAGAWEAADPELIRTGLAAADRLLGEPEAAHAMLRSMRADRVRELVRHSDARVRAAALQLLGRLRGPGDAELVVQALDDPEPRVRSSALVALRAFEKPSHADEAARLADDASEQVRMDALTTVAALAGPDAAVLDRARVDPSPRIRRWADVLSGSPGP